MKYWKPLPIFSITDKLIEYIEKNDNVFFIQIGANDGIHDPDNGYSDPLNPLIKQYNLNGIIIEPQPKVFEELRKTYKENNNLILEKIAIAQETKNKHLYTISFSTARWATGLASFYKEVIQKHIDNGRVESKAKEEGIKLPLKRSQYISSEEVECITFEDLMKKHNVNDISFILIDTEGYDYEIIKLIDFEKYKPSILIFEHKHLSVSDYKNCLDLLKQFNYVVRLNSGDTIAYQSSF
jgi:FkbM family methyltransferase